MSGREVSKENLWNLKQNLIRMFAKQNRISEQIVSLERLIAEHETTDSKCWGCVQSNRETTALSLCEVGNPLYPLACDEFEGK